MGENERGNLLENMAVEQIFGAKIGRVVRTLDKVRDDSLEDFLRRKQLCGLKVDRWLNS